MAALLCLALAVPITKKSAFSALATAAAYAGSPSMAAWICSAVKLAALPLSTTFQSGFPFNTALVKPVSATPDSREEPASSRARSSRSSTSTTGIRPPSPNSKCSTGYPVAPMLHPPAGGSQAGSATASDLARKSPLAPAPSSTTGCCSAPILAACLGISCSRNRLTSTRFTRPSLSPSSSALPLSPSSSVWVKIPCPRFGSSYAT